MTKKHKARREVYAVVRVDEFPGDASSWQDRVTVKEIVCSAEVAEAEVERLNRLNAHTGCVYFYQITRLYPEGTSAGPDASPAQ